MRVNEGETATKWPLCILCLEKVRGVGDLVGYVRMIRDGVVKCNEKDEELEAWDELIHLRERLFWARMAGGVVPTFLRSDKNSPAVPESSEGQGEIAGDGELRTRETPEQLDSPTPAVVLETLMVGRGSQSEGQLAHVSAPSQAPFWLQGGGGADTTWMVTGSESCVVPQALSVPVRMT